MNVHESRAAYTDDLFAIGFVGTDRLSRAVESPAVL
jgi:hypothetical protein